MSDLITIKYRNNVKMSRDICFSSKGIINICVSKCQWESGRASMVVVF